MLLSIIECSDYKKCDNWQNQTLKPQELENDIEVVGPVKGPSVSVMRNRGASVAKGRWLFFKDQDCQIDVTKLKSRVQQMESQKDSSVVGGIYKCQTSGHFARIYNCIQRRWVLGGLNPARKDEAQHLLGGALLVPAKIYQEVGPFNESIGWGAEETDWVQRALQLKVSSKVSYRLIVHHQNNLGFFGFLRRAWFQNFNNAYFGVERKNHMKRAGYFAGQMRDWPTTALFFGVASAGRGLGAVMRRGGF